MSEDKLKVLLEALGEPDDIAQFGEALSSCMRGASKFGYYIDSDAGFDFEAVADALRDLVGDGKLPPKMEETPDEYKPERCCRGGWSRWQDYEELTHTWDCKVPYGKRARLIRDRQGRIWTDEPEYEPFVPTELIEDLPLLDRLNKILEGATPGPWSYSWETCDCGGGYPCGHGSYRETVSIPDDFAHDEVSEISAFRDADADLIGEAPALLKEIAEKLRTRYDVRLVVDGLRHSAHLIDNSMNATYLETPETLRACADLLERIYLL